MNFSQLAFNLNGAFTLGACWCLVAYMCSKPINWIYHRYLSYQPLWLQVIMAVVTTVVVGAGVIFALILLGYWLAEGMIFLNIQQGIIK